MKKIILLKFLLTILLGCHLGLYSQEIPDIIPPSPQAVSLMKFGEFPVNHNTGIPDISIPLYTIKCGDISVPITLRYYAGGVKPNDQDMSNIGVGWTLQVGGMISRNIRGLCDEFYQKPEPFLLSHQIDQTISSHRTYLKAIADKNGTDSEYDEFSYSVLGKSGKFLIHDNRDGTFTPYAYPFIPDKIEVKTGPPPTTLFNQYREITGIDITNDVGMKFKFGYSNVESVGFPSGGTFGPTGWFLEKILSPTKRDSVIFTYAAIPQFRARNGDIKQVTVTNEGGILIGYSGATNDHNCIPNTALLYDCAYNLSALSTHYETKTLSRIDFENGYVKFKLSNSNKLLDSLIVYNNQNEVIRSIAFNRILSNTGYQYKLTSMVVAGQLYSTGETYEFTYYSDITPPSNFYPGIDHWGYCNGYNPLLASGNADCEIRQVNIIYGEDRHPAERGVFLTSIGTASFSPDASTDAHFMKHNTLWKIKYPTGGTTEFDFEPKTYLSTHDNPQTVKRGGGLRIKQIKSDDGQGNLITKTYQYGVGFIEHSLSDFTAYMSVSGYVAALCVDPNNGAEGFFSIMNTTYSNGWNGNLGPNNVYYKNITEYIGDATNNSGKIVYTYEYENPNEKSISAVGTFGSPSAYIKKYRNWGNGLLTKQEIYKWVSAENYEKIKEVTNEYEFIYLDTFQNLLVSEVCAYPDKTREDFILSGYNSSLLPYQYRYADYSIITGVYHIKSTLETEYKHGESIWKKRIYEYANPNHFYPTREIVESLSDGEKRVTDFYYVDEFSASAPYNTMKELNIIAPVVEKKEYLRNVADVDRLIHTEKSNYDYWNDGSWGVNEPNSLTVLRTVEFQTLNNAAEVRLRYHSYDDFGNPVTVSKENDVKRSYIWGYNKQYPIAQIVNADAKDIFHTSFETNGNSAFGDSRTGDRSKTGGFFKSLTNLANGNYLLTYWQKSGSTWSLQSNPVVVSTGSYNINLSGQVDEVRFYPENASMKTFAYTPMIGMSSQCDENNHITYFEYDRNNRPILVLDQDRNILKKYCYNYAGQPEDCNVTYYSNIDYSGTYYSQNCPSGHTPNPIYVSVPPASHSSTESVMAANVAAQQYAQSYANQNGTCSSPNVDLYYDNSAIGEVIYVVLTNVNTSQQTYYEISSPGYSYLGTIPQGTYNVEMGNMSANQSLIYEAGSGCTSPQMGHPVFFYNVVFDSFCYILSIY